MCRKQELSRHAPDSVDCQDTGLWDSVVNCLKADLEKIWLRKIRAYHVKRVWFFFLIEVGLSLAAPTVGLQDIYEKNKKFTFQR